MYHYVVNINKSKELNTLLSFSLCLPPFLARALVITLLSFTFLSGPFLIVSQE